MKLLTVTSIIGKKLVRNHLVCCHVIKQNVWGKDELRGHTRGW